MQTRAALGAVIRARRVKLGWTQEELAEWISVDGEYVRQSEISRIENGRIALPRRERLERLARVLELPLGELLARSGWAGAETQFSSVAIEADAKPTTDASLNGFSEALIEPDAEPRVFEAAPVPVGAFSRATTTTYDPDALVALRRALARMRTESDRLQHNRTVALAMQQQFRFVTEGDREGQPEVDYSSSAGG
ncbi:MAG TPA: helix-turn-helix transcriptional regulator [Thermomicrobiales bacterium]|nr:helix-turn-helix transcriptional regulator [Thermomicrobiales bacterium]